MTDSALTIDTLRTQIAAILEDPDSEFGNDDNLIDAGLDSMRAMNLAMYWDENGVPLDFTDLAEAPTVSELWALLAERQQTA